MKTVQCPNCKKDVVWSIESLFRPFCSKRCHIIDLGAWADGSYAIPLNTPLEEENTNNPADLNTPDDTLS